MSRASFSVRELGSALPHSGSLRVVLQVSVSFSQCGKTVHMSGSVTLLFGSLVSALVFFSPGVTITLPCPIVSYVVAGVFFYGDGLFVRVGCGWGYVFTSCVVWMRRCIICFTC